MLVFSLCNPVSGNIQMFAIKSMGSKVIGHHAPHYMIEKLAIAYLRGIGEENEGIKAALVSGKI